MTLMWRWNNAHVKKKAHTIEPTLCPLTHNEELQEFIEIAPKGDCFLKMTIKYTIIVS